MVFRKQSVGQS